MEVSGVLSVPDCRVVGGAKIWGKSSREHRRPPQVDTIQKKDLGVQESRLLLLLLLAAGDFAKGE